MAVEVSEACRGCAQFFPEADLKKCGRCRSVSYCSTDCQRSDWRANHKQYCRNDVAIANALEEGSLSAPAELARSQAMKLWMRHIDPALHTAAVQAYSLRLKESSPPRPASAADPSKFVLVLNAEFDYRQYKKGAPIWDQFELKHAALVPIAEHRKATHTLSGNPHDAEHRALTMRGNNMWSQKWLNDSGMSRLPAGVFKIPQNIQVEHSAPNWGVTGGPGYDGDNGGLVVARFHEARLKRSVPGLVYPIADESKWVDNLKRRLERMKRNPRWLQELDTQMLEMSIQRMKAIRDREDDMTFDERRDWAIDCVQAMRYYGSIDD